MKLPEYVPAAEVKKTCKELKISDWTKKKKAVVSPAEAKIILSKVNTGKMKIDPEEFRKGLEVELEHGVTFTDANVTNNHPLLTGLIVMAHFKETSGLLPPAGSGGIGRRPDQGPGQGGFKKNQELLCPPESGSDRALPGSTETAQVI